MKKHALLTLCGLTLLSLGLYSPSALGEEMDRLSTGAFEDEELTALLAQMREGVDHLSRLVVLLKGYTAERQEQA